MTEESRDIITESGLPGPTLPAVTEKTQTVPNGGTSLVPHYQTYTGIYNQQSHLYRYTHDEALRASLRNALSMRLDPILIDSLRARQMPTAQLTWHIEPQDETDQRQSDAAEKITKIINAIPRFQQLKMHLLEAIWYGRYAVKVSYAWDYSTGEREMRVRDFQPINGDKLFFKWGGDVGILVNSTFEGNTVISDRGMVYMLSPAERECLITHTFEPEDSDFTEPEMAGAIHGVGVRGRLYYFWLLKQQVLAQLLTYLERCASGFTIYYFDASNPESEAKMKEYVQQQQGQTAVLFPRFKGGTDGYSVQRVEPGMAGASMLENLVTGYFDDVMRRYILGQTLTSGTAPTGMGSGIADAHSDTLARITKYDSINLADSLTEDLVKVLYRWNCPGVPPGAFKIEVDTPNSGKVLEAAQILYNMQIPINADELYRVAGLAPPEQGDGSASKLNDMGAASVGQTPLGIPTQGTSGPINPSQDTTQQPPSQQPQQNILAQ